MRNLLKSKLEEINRNKDEIEDIILELRKHNVPSKERHITSNYIKCHIVGYNTDSLYDYRIRFINGILRVIRKHGVDYCFTLEHIKDLLRFEPNLKITYDEKNYCFEVSL